MRATGSHKLGWGGCLCDRTGLSATPESGQAGGRPPGASCKSPQSHGYVAGGSLHTWGTVT